MEKGGETDGVGGGWVVATGKTGWRGVRKAGWRGEMEMRDG